MTALKKAFRNLPYGTYSKEYHSSNFVRCVHLAPNGWRFKSQTGTLFETILQHNDDIAVGRRYKLVRK